MSKEHLEQFLGLVERDQAMQAQLNGAPDNAGFAKLAVQLGAEKGYSFTEAEIRSEMAAMGAGPAKGELTEEQLESVAGGLLGDGICTQRTIKPRSTYSYNCTDGAGPNCGD